MHTESPASTRQQGVARRADPALAERIRIETRGLAYVRLRRAYRLLGKETYDAAWRHFCKRHPDEIDWQKKGAGKRAPIYIPVSEIYRYWGLEMPEARYSGPTFVQVLAEVLPDGTLRVADPALALA